MKSKTAQATISDVARAARVSVSTVSRVLNNKDDVGAETKEKVRQAAKELRFSPSLAAKGMRSRTTHVIGLVLPEVTEPFELAVIQGVGSAIRGSGYDLLIYAADNPPLSRRASWEQEHVALLSSGLTDGNIVVTPAASTFPEKARIVVIDPKDEGANVPSIVATNRMGALAVMEYLVGLGHRRIGFIGGRSDALSAMRRFEGYKDGLTTAGLPYDPALVQSGDYTRQRGQEAARQLLSQPNPPTAIFAANDASAMGVMDIAQELGLRIPQSLSVVGFDNIPETMRVTPQLTTVDQSIQEMGALATRMLIRMLQGEEPKCLLCKVPTHLIMRESCQAIPAQ
ncbi:MAG: LacI family DNA-binding transcriptional regulator [Anaerolineales bacterium]